MGGVETYLENELHNVPPTLDSSYVEGRVPRDWMSSPVSTGIQKQLHDLFPSILASTEQTSTTDHTLCLPKETPRLDPQLELASHFPANVTSR